MGYVDGESLADRVRARGPLPLAEAVGYMREVAWALAYAHARGVVHRDVKPENIMIDRGSRRAIVTDFGIAHDTRASRLTIEGHVLGSVHFMSPEQASGDVIDGRSDLYALGVVGYHALSARLPFDDERAAAVIVALVTRSAPPLRDVAPDVPTAVAAIIARCLSKDPADRWAEVEALADALGDAMTAADADAERRGRDDHTVLGEQQAAAVWRRAAPLQTEALQKLDDLRGATDLLRSDGAEPLEGYRLRDVRQAAIEAGISGQFVALALAELPAGAIQSPNQPAETGGWIARTAPRILGTEQQSLSVSRVIRASPRRVLSAIGQVLQQDPFALILRDTVGGHPLDGGVLVFDLPPASGITAQQLAATWMGTRFQLEARQLEVAIRAVPDDGSACEVTIYTDLRPGIPPNVKVGVGVAGALAATGVGAGGFAGSAMASAAAVGAASTLVAGLAAALFPARLSWVVRTDARRSAR